MTTEDVADWLRMDVVTVRRLISRGELPAYRVGGEFRFKASDLEEYLERQRVTTDNGTGVRELARGRFKKLVQRGQVAAPFERFTERARGVLVLAQDEAKRLRHSHVGTEHLLLGLFDESNGIAAIALRELGLDLAQIRTAIEQKVPMGSDEVKGEVGLTGRVKKVLELAADEARQLDHDYIGTEHLLLGMMREGEGVGARILRDLNISFENVKERIVHVLRSSQ
ncbi:MAG TPA: Clp protease N-terminal domain-containing protein [Chloroflexota bacterium]